jgi:hypothetical protein
LHSRTDIRDSPEYFANFQRNRLAAGIQQAGMQGQREVVIAPVHRLLMPV